MTYIVGSNFTYTELCDLPIKGGVVGLILMIIWVLEAYYMGNFGQALLSFKTSYYGYFHVYSH